ncbi:cysteine desulfurase NifS [Cohaesibacter sp. CAU 1516]|uniref:cysteine desulfurase NifS n=1 Tax=Cohaesibacter sp. CAU 1516 TaxID=2576038 RepID=UPI0010FD2F5C|nr:cysteine desulfurase NifS [Cohaesibacter sp. CAU 1516]TLP44243.1 cysteine desulfurase NifS [Cohaesibacter sp. CAU 1516]
MGSIYLDNNATTQVDEAVVAAMLPYFTEQFGNPSSLHQFGNGVARAVKAARQQVQALLGAAHESEIIFTSCGTEADNCAILSALKAQPSRREIITTNVEHPAVLSLCQSLEQDGYRVHYLKVDMRGRLDLDAYKALLSDKVALVTVMWANNETGTLFPIAAMAALASDAGVLFHTDAVQAVGKVPIDLKRLPVDMLSLSGHKLHAPKGIGVLYLKRGTRFRPLLRGGHQERGHRAGTENVPSIIGLGKACDMALGVMRDEMHRVRILRDRLEDGILSAIPNCFVTGDPDNRLPNTSMIAFDAVEGDDLLLLLNKMGVAASSGSACSSGSQEPSHVMRAMGIPDTAMNGAIRFSLSRNTNQAEIDRVINIMPPIVAQLRSLSPYWGTNGPVESPDQAFNPAYA